MDLAIRLLAPASQPWKASACESVRFRFTAAGQFRSYTGFPFKPDRRSRLDGHRRTQHIGCLGRGQPNLLCISRGISRARRAAARALRGCTFLWPSPMPSRCCDSFRRGPDRAGQVSERVVIQFAGADADHLFQRADENLAVADLASAGGVLDCLQYALQLVVGNGHFQLDLG